MTSLSVIYPRAADADFDFDYYERTHLPLVVERWRDSGLVEAKALRGVGALDGRDSDFFAIALIRFDSAESLRAAVAGEHAAEIMGDIPNFTTVRPLVQVNETIGG